LLFLIKKSKAIRVHVTNKRKYFVHVKNKLPNIFILSFRDIYFWKIVHFFGHAWTEHNVMTVFP
jgi:hypothetical protein